MQMIKMDVNMSIFFLKYVKDLNNLKEISVKNIKHTHIPYKILRYLYAQKPLHISISMYKITTSL